MPVREAVVVRHFLALTHQLATHHHAVFVVVVVLVVEARYRPFDVVVVITGIQTPSSRCSQASSDFALALAPSLPLGLGGWDVGPVAVRHHDHVQLRVLVRPRCGKDPRGQFVHAHQFGSHGFGGRSAIARTRVAQVPLLVRPLLLFVQPPLSVHLLVEQQLAVVC